MVMIGIIKFFTVNIKDSSVDKTVLGSELNI